MSPDPLPPSSFPSGSFPPSDSGSVSKNRPENLLIEEIAEFYVWYVTSSWFQSEKLSFSSDSQRSNGDTTRNLLSRIRRIAEVSISGGNYLSFQEVNRAHREIRELISDLNNGRIKKRDLPDLLDAILQEMTAQNPKAKVISHITELEYRLCINPGESQPTELTEHYRQTLEKIVHAINPRMSNVNASAIAQGLAHVIGNMDKGMDVPRAIADAIKHWV